MLPVFALITATVGLLLIVFLVMREVGGDTEGIDKNAMYAAAAFTLAIGVWQVIAHLPGAGSGGH